jgi:hypothetical protein
MPCQRPPKSKRSSRFVPLGEQLGGELDRHFQRSDWQADDDLVFPNPLTGEPLDPSALLRRVSCRYARYVMRFFFHHRSTVGNKGGANAPGWNCAAGRISQPKVVGSCSRNGKLVTAYRA